MTRYEILPVSRAIQIFDAVADGDFGTAWTDDAVADRLAVLPDGFSVATDRETSVPLEFEVADARPDIGLDGWDHVVEVGIEATSGRLLIDDEGLDFDEVPTVEVPAGSLAALVLSGGLGTAEGQITGGRDHYKVIIWPERVDRARVLKRGPA